MMLSRNMTCLLLVKEETGGGREWRDETRDRGAYLPIGCLPRQPRPKHAIHQSCLYRNHLEHLLCVQNCTPHTKTRWSVASWSLYRNAEPNRTSEQIKYKPFAISVVKESQGGCPGE